MRRALLHFLRLSLALTLAFVLWAGWYLYNKGFTKKWRGFVTSELSERGLDVTIRRLTLDPFQGLVAKDVRVMDEGETDRVLAVIDRVVLDVNIANFMQGRAFLNALDLRDANLDLPLDPAERRGPRIEIRHLDARVLLPPHEIYVSQLEADVHGIHLSAKGRLINTEAFSPPPGSPEDAAGRARLFERIIAELRALDFGASPPRVEISFAGDLARPEEIFAEGTVWAASVERRGYRVEAVRAAAAWRDGVLNVKQLTLRDGLGNLRASGMWHPAERLAKVQLRSGLDVTGVARALDAVPTLQEAVLYAPPEIEASAEISLGEKPRVSLLGRVEIGRFGFRSVVFEGLEGDVAWEGKRWFIREARLEHRSGEIAAEAMRTEAGFRLRARSSLNPSVVQPFLTGKPAAFMQEWEFIQPPQIEVEARGPGLDPAGWEGEGRVHLGRTIFRGVGLDAADSKITLRDQKLAFEDLVVEREEGRGTGTILYDFAKPELRIKGVRSNLDSVIAKWITAEVAHHVAPYLFHGAPLVSLDGVVQLRGGRDTRLVIDIDAPRGLDYVFLKKRLTSPSARGRLLFTDHRLQISGLKAALFSGEVRGSADISLHKNKPGYSAVVAAENVQFPQLTKLYFGYEGSEGLLNGEYRFSGRDDSARTMRGSGAVTVSDGNVFAIPVLGPLSGVLNGIVPGMGYNVARKASATFTIEEGVIATNDFVVDGKGFNMLGGGRLFFLDDRIDLSMRINAKGLPGVLLFPVSKLFEYEAGGKLSEPEWHAKRLPF